MTRCAGASPHRPLRSRRAKYGRARGGVPRTRLIPLSKLRPTSGELDRLNVDGARLISPQARRELVNRIQATPEEGRRFAVATRLGWHGGKIFVLPDEG